MYATSRRGRSGPPAKPGPRSFSRPQIVEAIRAWTARHGSPPTYRDWDAAAARRAGELWRIERFTDGTWPSTRVVRRQFGTFSAALVAAGLPPGRTGGAKAPLSGPDAILDAIRAWTATYGEPPAQTDWDPFRAQSTGQPWRGERYRAGDWPSLPTVRKHFGGLPGATAAAGLEPAPQHERPADRAARRRRNRLALVDHHARRPCDLAGLVAAIRAVHDADGPAQERALLELSGRALALADAQHGRLT